MSSPHHSDFAAARLAMAEADLAEAEAVDLATATPAELVILTEKIRGSLSDIIRLARSLLQQPPDQE